MKKSLSTIKAILVATSISCGLTFGTVASAQGLQNQLNSMFDSMVNVTDPGVFETQRRGVISGGRFTVKNKIFNTSIVSFVPPAFSGSCNGIDIFGGSFSFINSEQLIQLLRSIAANAAGYAFYLAIDNVCPDCAKYIDALSKRVQELNQHLGNSCQLAKGIVNDTFDAFGLQKKGEESIVATTTGLVDGFLNAWYDSGKSPGETIKENAPDKYAEMTGNLVWKQMKFNGARYWYSNNDDTLLEAMMTLTGSIIVDELEETTGGPEGSSTPPKENRFTTVPGYKIRLADIINGGSVNIYSCDHDKENCAGLGDANRTKNITIKGLKTQIQDVFLGTDDSSGLVYKYATGTGTPTETEKAISEHLPGGMGALIRNLALNSQDLARQFVIQSAGAIATAMASNVASDLILGVRNAMANSRSSYNKNVFDEMNNSQRLINTELTKLVSEYGSISGLHDSYNSMIQNGERIRLHFNGQRN